MPHGLVGQLLRPWALNAEPVLPVFAGWNARWVLVALAWALLLGAALYALAAFALPRERV